MLSLHFAPSADLLVTLVTEKIREAWKDPFAPPAVIVPSPAVGKWLRMRLAGAGFGCIANLEMQTLERFLWKILKPAEGIEMLEVNHLQQIICALLDEQLLKQKIYKPLYQYLFGPDKKEIDPLKRVQLSARIARQFREYEFNRPSVWDEKNRRWKTDRDNRCGLDASWLQGKNYCNGIEHEAWQKDLYCKADECLRRSGSGNTPGKSHYISLPHLYRQRREEAAKDNSEWSEPPENIIVFGVSKVSHFHRNTLVEISQIDGRDMSVFLTNPCAEFWEDVDTSRRPRRKWNFASSAQDAGVLSRKPEDYEQEELKDFAHLPPDQKLLELWGGAGRENIFLWCPQAQWNFEYHSPDAAGPHAEPDAVPDTLLTSLQQSLLRRQTFMIAPKGGPFDDDGTLRVLACPDRRREIEELREQILDCVNAKKIARLNDVVVYLPDPGEYAPYIQNVFGSFLPGDPLHIPFTILGAPGSDSVFTQGMRAFLDCVKGQFDRAHVFALLRNPIVQVSRGFSAADVSKWESWAEELGIYRGYNRGHREEMGDKGPAATDVHTFELGVARMLIGNLAAGKVQCAYTLFNDGAKDSSPPPKAFFPPFRDFETSDIDLLEKFCFTLEDFFNDAQKINAAAEQAISGSIETLTGIVWSWFGNIPEDIALSGAAEARVRREFLDSLQSINLQKTYAGRDTIPRMELCAHIDGCLPAELPASSSAWTNGITFAPLRPAMVVPHKVVFVLGLDATAFPGTSEKPAWDLLSRTRIVGDSDPVRDNRFAFLELLHAAQERLILSYRARDMQKEADLQSSSVVLELEAFLVNHGLTVKENGTDRCLIHRVIPWIVHEDLDGIRDAGRGHGSWDPVEIVLAEKGRIHPRKTHRHELSPGIGAQPKEASADTRFRTNIYNLRKFFSNPLEYHLSKNLGMEIDEDPATAGATDEPLDSGVCAMSTLQKRIWTALLARVFPNNRASAMTDPETLADEAETVAEAAYNDHIVSGQSPEAQVCSMEKQFLREWARTCAEKTVALSTLFAGHQLLENSDLSLGREGAPGELTVAIDKSTTCIIECRHALALVPRDWKREGNSIGILGIKTEGKAAENQDLWLPGVVQGLREQWWEKDARHRPIDDRIHDMLLIQLNRRDGGWRKASMKKEYADFEKINAWFIKLLRSMLIDRCSDHLPFGVIQKLYKNDWTNITGDEVNGDLESTYGGYRCYLEGFDLADARVPDVSDDELRERAKGRFAPMLERWVHE